MKKKVYICRCFPQSPYSCKCMSDCVLTYKIIYILREINKNVIINHLHDPRERARKAKKKRTQEQTPPMNETTQDRKTPMTRKEIVASIKEGLHKLPLDIEVWLYGSEARGDARPDSDIDLLVLFNKPEVRFEDKDKIYEVTYPIELETGISIQPFIISKARWESRMTPFRDNVLTDRIRL